ncbi:MAG: proline iminopeptidase-family hydrolase [Pseudomonas sp.]
MEISEGYAAFGEYRTWYRISGELGGERLPLVVLHGGPGCTHDYVDSFKDLAGDGRAVIHYDQLGNGRSTHLPGIAPEFWSVERFLAELDNLLRHLGLARFALLGQSWGGMLAAEFAVRRPAGLAALVIANSPASMALWRTAAAQLRAQLPEPVQRTLALHEAAGSYAHPDYKAATDVFYARHVCRVQPWPIEVARTFAAIEVDPTVYHAMNGPNEFHVIGSLRDWDIVPRLGQVAAPTLVISGRHDEATPEAVAPYAERIPGARWHIFEHSSHMPHVEERAACMQVVGEFLAGCE